MFPLYDDVPSERFPFVTYAIVVTCVIVWLVEWSQGEQIEQFLLAYAVVPARLTHAVSQGAWGAVAVPALLAMFMHGGWLHLIGNMWFLHIFGDNVEGRLGHFKYLLFYLASGFAATAAQVALSPNSGVPMVGASGAIAGVLGAYMVMFPYSRVLTLFTLGFFITTAHVAAPWFLGLWFGVQALSGLLSLGVTQSGGGVAFFAHIGGFVVGFLAGFLFRGGRPGGRFRDHYYDRFDRYP